MRERLVEVLGRYRGRVESYAFAILRDFHLVEDVVQEVALIAARRDQLPPDEVVLPWLLETTRRKSLELSRRHRHGKPRFADPTWQALAEAWTRERESDESSDRTQALSHCLEQLAEPARAVIDARYGDGLSGDRIAEQLGRSVQAVYGMLKRARQSLTECVERKLGGLL